MVWLVNHFALSVLGKESELKVKFSLVSKILSYGKGSLQDFVFMQAEFTIDLEHGLFPVCIGSKWPCREHDLFRQSVIKLDIKPDAYRIDFSIPSHLQRVLISEVLCLFDAASPQIKLFENTRLSHEHLFRAQINKRLNQKVLAQAAHIDAIHVRPP